MAEESELVPLDPIRQILQSTPARLLVGRSGPAYRTSTALQLRADHAAARDAVRSELDWKNALGPELIQRFGLFEVQSQARSKDEYLLRPDLGRKFAPQALELILNNCPMNADVQIVIGDGLSCTAVESQVPALLPALSEEFENRHWSVGRSFVVRYARVGLLNAIGEILKPKTVVLLIGERPGLATSESLSAYMAYSPHAGQTDADRNLIANIHTRGVTVPDAVRRIATLLELMWAKQKSGIEIKEG
ncbi:ethanolamine ammonia-lyase subunit EutC [Telmatocola sphagniphila]|uniref:Ethanolamine ammonia-lyase small subunit n=1 Tax=Telmatocola sphagniphila TaxID=1123043 RepID=A0A8E6B3K0_9BACT|nr:ethanolamine ammonia-lyase subunit EutC [Telmatocola sphagniphila]QVL31081.1 ethanolamine ammonia-lyase subunit EutC [Telmatocola sphagniphila]